MVFYRKTQGRPVRLVRPHRDTEIGSSNIDTCTADRVLSIALEHGHGEFRCRETGSIPEARRYRAMMLVVAAEYAVAGGWTGRPWGPILDAYREGYVFAADTRKEAA